MEIQGNNGSGQNEPAAPPVIAPVPPPLPPLPSLPSLPSLPKAGPAAGSPAYWWALVLNVCFALFLAEAAASLLDDSLVCFFGVHIFSVIRGILSFFAFLMTIGIYGLIGLTPKVPKRLFLPIALYNPVMLLALLPLCVYYHAAHQFKLMDVIGSAGQVVLGLILLRVARGGFKPGWPLVPASGPEVRWFSWKNLGGFVAANVLVLLPVTLVYLFFCASLAVGHFTGGFLSLRPGGLQSEVRKYVRDDGKMIELFPMAHVADAGFYKKVSQTFPSNSIILMEGVSDEQNLLTNKISYKRMAKSLGLSEQHEEFSPGLGKMVRADVDISIFSKETLGMLNLIMLIHAKGMNPDALQQLTLFQPPPNFEEQLFGDLLGKRNEHLLGEIQSHLADSDNLMIPWGAGHMPGIARGILKDGFHLDQTQEYMVIHFRGLGNSGKVAGSANSEEKVK